MWAGSKAAAGWFRLPDGAGSALCHDRSAHLYGIALILVDVDTFKSVNDTYGHATGDEILKKVADTLQKAFRSIDYVCRIGGDEFAIVMVEMTSDLNYTIEDKIAVANERLASGADARYMGHKSMDDNR